MPTERSIKQRAADAKLRSMLRSADPGREYSTREIADKTGLSHQRVTQIEQKALKKLRTFGCGRQVLSELILELRKK